MDSLKEYSVKTSIGKGSYGTVYFATDRESKDRVVAIKHLSNVDANKISTMSTVRELHLLSVLRHSNIISLVDL